MQMKKRYSRGDLVQLVKSSMGKEGSLGDLKPPALKPWNVPLDRTDLFFVIRHEEGGGKDGTRFVGSVLVFSRVGIVWIDARHVICVRELPPASPAKP